jgi:hypothetical protein
LQYSLQNRIRGVVVAGELCRHPEVVGDSEAVIEQIAAALDAITREGRRPVLIEMGELQARTVTEELNEGWHLQQRLGFTWDNTAPKPISWQKVIQGDGWLFGVRVRGVESPDYLNVVGD